MRIGAGFIHSAPLAKMTTVEATISKATYSAPSPVQASPWHSPVPYVFGGLAVMMGLIVFSLLVLACSYWTFSNGVESDAEGGAAGKGDGAADAGAPPVFEEKFLVIMAGDVNPSFLATQRACFIDDDAVKSEEKDGKAASENGGGSLHVIREQTR